MIKGTFCLSFDVELLWGRHDINYKDFIARVEKERYIIDSLLAILNKYHVSATWAFVGHVMLEECQKHNGQKHPEIIRGNFPWVNKDWFDLDPCSTLKRYPTWYGKDILEKVKKVKSHDIGSHSFSHVQFGNPGCSTKCAESEVKKCVEIAKRNNIQLRSFVFPYNSVGHLDILKKYGFAT